jgi:hypothetical protein
MLPCSPHVPVWISCRALIVYSSATISQGADVGRESRSGTTPLIAATREDASDVVSGERETSNRSSVAQLRFSRADGSAFEFPFVPALPTCR